MNSQQRMEDNNPAKRCSEAGSIKSASCQSCIGDSCEAQSTRDNTEEIDRLARLCEAKDAEIAKEKKDHQFTVDTYRNLIEPRHKQELSEAQAQIAMQAEAIKAMAEDGWMYCGPEGLSDAQEKVLACYKSSATSETVAAWRAKETEKIRIAVYEVGYSRCMEDNFVGADTAAQIYAKGKVDGAKETEPLRREVAVLHNFKYELMGIAADVDAGNGFDIVCRQTLRRVIDSLSDAQATALAYEREVKAKALEEAADSCQSMNNTSYAAGKLLRDKAIELRAANKGKEEK